MKILIYLSHPAQFLFFKNSIIHLRQKGHKIFILVKTKDVLTSLLDELGWEYYNILPKERKKYRLSIFISLIKRNFKIYFFAKKNKINLMIGTDASIAQIGWLFKIPCITTLEDDYKVIKNLAKLTYPYTSTILTPNICDVGKWNNKKIGYNGYMKLAYLHPNWFSPNKLLISSSIKYPYCLIRLSNLSAHHDFLKKGISNKFLEKIISIIEKNGNSVYISSERNLPDNLKKYKLDIPVSNIHHYLYFSRILICDSQSMAVEASILGTPNIRITTFKGEISVLEELEDVYKLTFGFKPDDENLILEKLEELLNEVNLTENFKYRKEKMLSEKIDVSNFLTWFIENYPQSFCIMKNDPDYQNKFK